MLRLAEKGDSNAQRFLWHLSGRNFLPGSRMEGQKWLTKAAMAGDAYSAEWLALDYEFGPHQLPRCPPTACKWYRVAAHQGMGRSQYRLAGLLEKGAEGEVNLREAAKWYRAATKTMTDADKIREAQEGYERCERQLLSTGKTTPVEKQP